MLGIYFSGTGNTRYCVETFLTAYGEPEEALSIENSALPRRVGGQTELVIGYPVQYSNIPKMLRDFVVSHRELWANKRVFIIATMGLFSGDGAGVLARLLQRFGATITGGLHLKMPDSICDESVLKRSLDENKLLVAKAAEKIERAAAAWKRGAPPQEGLGTLSRLRGLFGQRLYFCRKTASYSARLKIDIKKCTRCGKCVKLCPMENLVLESKTVRASGRCTMCYRCVSRCPVQAITLLGKTVIEQCYIEKYLP